MDLQTLIVFFVLLIGMLLIFVVLQKRHRSLQSELQLQQDKYQSLSLQFQLITDSASGLGQKLTSLESDLKVRNSAPQEGASSADISLRQAIELARKGATVDELIEICGLSRGESELLSTMHKQPAR